MFHINNPLLDLYMQCDIQVTSSKAYYYGGVFYISGIKVLRITTNAYTTFFANYDGSFMYSTSTSMNL
jgi:hypothetical protein